MDFGNKVTHLSGTQPAGDGLHIPHHGVSHNTAPSNAAATSRVNCLCSARKQVQTKSLVASRIGEPRSWADRAVAETNRQSPVVEGRQWTAVLAVHGIMRSALPIAVVLDVSLLLFVNRPSLLSHRIASSSTRLACISVYTVLCRYSRPSRRLTRLSRSSTTWSCPSPTLDTDWAATSRIL